MGSPSKPTWQELPEEIRNAWIQQTQAFYPVGSTTLAEATELAQYEYDQSESDSLLPVVDTGLDLELS
jgi:hypothetical protein